MLCSWRTAAFAALCACGLLAQQGEFVSAYADDQPQAASESASGQQLPPEAPHERAFMELLRDAVLVGSFTIDQDGAERGERNSERYAIRSITKVRDDRWLVNAQITYGQLDVTVPVPVEVHWANDTPILSVTDLSIPLVGSEFTARVMFFDGRYAGTWRHGQVGGLMFGRIERGAAESPVPEAKSPPVESGGVRDGA
jgi:hypothetical protein